MAASISLSSTTSTVFPPPPPTTNTLTLEQRAQLRKSAKKLKQVLGATPQLLDTDIVGILGPVHVQLQRSNTSSSLWSQSSCDSFSSRSSSSLSFYPSHPYATCTSFERKTPAVSSLSRQGSLRTKSPSSSSTSQAPVLRLAVAPPSPTSSSSSSSFLSKASLKFDLIAPHSRSKSVNELVSTADTSSDMRFILHPTRHSSAVEPSDPICDSAARAPSSSAARRQKMNRLRKMLGADVPVHLVFPDGKEDEEVAEAGGCEMVTTDERPVPFSPTPVATTVTPRPKKNGPGKIMGTRDSMGIVSPHRAKRQEKQKQEKNSPPPYTLPLAATPAPTFPKDSSEKPLCVIVESPDEHGSSPFEAFGFGGSAMKSTVVVESKWHVTSSTTGSGIGLDDASKLWNTRRGYSGWDRPTAMGKSESARKKSMSYRKPPPPIDF